MSYNTTQRLPNPLQLFIPTLGKSVAWLTLIAATLTFTIVILRRFGIGSIATQETILYMHATVFLLGAAYTLQADRHVRVDIFYQHLPASKKTIINTLGHCLLLIPVCIGIMIVSWDFVRFSWLIQEGSQESGGLAGVYLVKSLMILMPCLLIYQALLEVIQTLLRYRSHAK